MHYNWFFKPTAFQGKGRGLRLDVDSRIQKRSQSGGMKFGPSPERAGQLAES
jgi:hypothetical protein